MEYREERRRKTPEELEISKDDFAYHEELFEIEDELIDFIAAETERERKRNKQKSEGNDQLED